MAKDKEVSATPQPPKVEAKEDEAKVMEFPETFSRRIQVGEKIYEVDQFLALIYNDLQKLKKAVL